DVLVNNAGLFTADYRETADGHEMQFGVNHLSHFLLTNLLLDKIKAAPQGRIINVSSIAHFFGALDFNDFHHKKNYFGLRTYAQTKAANVLFTKELDRRLRAEGNESVTVNCLHPGAVGTNFGGQSTNFFIDTFWQVASHFMLSPAKGAATSIYLASEEKLSTVSGKYFDNCKIKTPSSYVRKSEPARRLWEVSEELVN
ncbi:MAG: SDR family NAD(P)-dependent oxidoreductase, partial [Bacteroidota bacterium]